MRTITHHQGAHSNALSRAIEVTTDDGRVYSFNDTTHMRMSSRPTKGPSPAVPDGISDEALIAVLEDRAEARAADPGLTAMDRSLAGRVQEHLRYAREWLENLTEEPLPKPAPPKPAVRSLSFQSPEAIAAGLGPKGGSPKEEPLSETRFEGNPSEAEVLRAQVAAALPAPLTPAASIVFPATQ